MNHIDLLFSKAEGLSCDSILDTIGEFANLSLFELQNIRTTAAQHNIVNFMIEFRKSNNGILPVKDEIAVKQLNEFYQSSLTMNSPVSKDLIL